MRRICCKFFILVLLAGIARNIHCADSPISVDKIISAMDTATDPNNTKHSIKTLITVINLSLPMQLTPIKITVTDKFPDKSKTVRELPNGAIVTRILNGNQAWEFSNNTNTREITGQELKLMKFEMFMKNPAVGMRQAFTDIKLADTNSTVEKFHCYKLICIPAVNTKTYPITMFIDKKTFLIRKIVMKAMLPTGEITLTSIPGDYKKINGRIVPFKVTIIQNGMILEKHLMSVKENIEIPDSDFENPTVEIYK